ncbi:hypothetical protein L210DRAFT_3560937 [Boletus edulis BED1]|uniref:Uncharacterized protein n=1 Tax=Boletus edulis BED1 TaxID=1328754 RepID=A0AAD4BHU4_BOLED|nr:hypothetical protein L210DRAFT_3560937 [Boletus edulis BED1]
MKVEGLTHEDLLQEDRLGTFLKPVDCLDSDSSMCSVSSITDPYDQSPELEASPPPSPEPDISPSTTPELGLSSPPTSEVDSSPPTPIDNPWTVITRIRARNIPFGRKRIPVGSYVSIQCDSAHQRTQNQPIQLHHSDIEWEDVIFSWSLNISRPFQASGKVRFTVYASFELKPMLGNGEVLYMSDPIDVDELAGGTHLIRFSQGELGTATPDPSLLVTVGQWYSTPLAVTPNGDDSNMELEESSDLIRETNSGQEALLRYHDEYQRDCLEAAVQHFEYAWHNCPLTHPCRAVVLVNLAKAKFTSYQIGPGNAGLDELIQLYRDTLKLRRPATLLNLAQTLLFRYEQECTESIAEEINELTADIVFFEDTHERRAADLVLDTLERCKVQNAKVSLDGYFDKPQRLINLSAILWKRYEKRGELGDLDELLEVNEQALQLLPSRHPDQLPCLRTLRAVLRKLFEIRADHSYLVKLCPLSDEALQLIPDGHPERSQWVTNSTSHLAEAAEHSGDAAFDAHTYNDAIAQYSQAVVLWYELCRSEEPV